MAFSFPWPSSVSLPRLPGQRELFLSFYLYIRDCFHRNCIHLSLTTLPDSFQEETGYEHPHDSRHRDFPSCSRPTDCCDGCRPGREQQMSVSLVKLPPTAGTYQTIKIQRPFPVIFPSQVLLSFLDFPHHIFHWSCCPGFRLPGMDSACPNLFPYVPLDTTLCPPLSVASFACFWLLAPDLRLITQGTERKTFRKARAPFRTADRVPNVLKKGSLTTTLQISDEIQCSLNLFDGG